MRALQMSRNQGFKTDDSAPKRTKMHRNAPSAPVPVRPGLGNDQRRLGTSPDNRPHPAFYLMEMLMINMFACSGALHPDGWVLGPEGGGTPRPYGARP